MCVSEQCANPILTFLHGRGDLSIYLVLYLQRISTVSAALTDVRKQLAESSVYPWKQILQALEFHKTPQNIRPFCPRYPEVLSGVVYGGRTGRNERQFLFFPSSWPFTSKFLYQHCARNAALSGAWILPGLPISTRRRRMGAGDTCCHGQSFIAFILLPVIERSAKFFLDN